ncbi:MAG: hypothetical protein RR350_02795, partial [Oscillibacter sp.]
FSIAIAVYVPLRWCGTQVDNVDIISRAGLKVKHIFSKKAKYLKYLRQRHSRWHCVPHRPLKFSQVSPRNALISQGVFLFS